MECEFSDAQHSRKEADSAIGCAADRPPYGKACEQKNLAAQITVQRPSLLLSTVRSGGVFRNVVH